MDFIKATEKKYVMETDKQGRLYISRIVGYHNDNGTMLPEKNAVVMIYKGAGGGRYFDDWQETADKILKCLNS